jgi:hypothetical protein
MEQVGEVQPLLRRPGRHDVQGRLDAPAHVERAALEVEPAGLDLREVEDVVDDGEERVPAGADDLGQVPLLGGQLGVEQELGHADDRVHRRADLVAHGGEEGALGLGGRLGLAAGTQQLADVVVDRVHPDLLAADEDRGGPHVDIHQRPVLAGPPGHEVRYSTHPGLPGDAHRLGVQLFRSSDEVVHVAPARLRLRVPEEPFRRRVPRGDPPLEIDRDDRRRAELQQRLEELLLPPHLRLAAAQRILRPLALGDVDQEALDVARRPVLVPLDHGLVPHPDRPSIASHQAVLERPARHPGGEDPREIGQDQLPVVGVQELGEEPGIGQPVLGGVAEQAFHLGADVDRRGDRDRLIDIRHEWELLDELSIAPLSLVLCPERGDVVVDDEVSGRPTLHRHQHREELDVHERAVLPATPRHGPEAPARDQLVVVADRLRPEVVSIRDEVVQVTPDRLRPRIAEQGLGGQVP